jgi:hypothetical protein
MKIVKGDVFLVPLNNGDYALGQIIDYETRALHCISIGLFDQKVSSIVSLKDVSINENTIYSTLLAFHINIERGKWPIIGNQELKVPKKLYPFEKELKKGGVGAKIFSEGNIEDFVNAFYGLKPWNLYKQEDFFDRLLIDSKKKPKNLIYK